MMKLACQSLTLALLVTPAFAATGAPPAAPTSGQERTYVIPHVIETPGRTDAAPNTYDTNVNVLDARGAGGARRAGDVDHLALYLYDDAGHALVSATGEEVCNPCQFDLDPQVAHRRVISMEEQILAKGGFPSSPVPGTPAAIEGYGVLVVGGTDVDQIVLDVTVETSGATANRGKDGCCTGHVTLIK